MAAVGGERQWPMLPGAGIDPFGLHNRAGIFKIFTKMNRPVSDLAFLKMITRRCMDTGPAEA